MFMASNDLPVEQHRSCSVDQRMKSATPWGDHPPTVGNDDPPFTADLVSDELLTVNDAARLLHVSVSWVYEHTREDAEDRLPFVKLGKYVRFDRADLREFINAKRQAARNATRRR